MSLNECAGEPAQPQARIVQGTTRNIQHPAIHFMLEIYAFESGPVATFAYLAVDEETKDAVIIDAPPSEVMARPLIPILSL